MKIMVLGASGMLGHAMLAVLAEQPSIDVIGTVRSKGSVDRLNSDLRQLCSAILDVGNQDELVNALAEHQPDVVINCVGLIKQLSQASDPLAVLPVNAILPHRLAHLCKLSGIRLIHISTDCVFSGSRGAYREDDISDAIDLYGKSKYLGEIDYPHCVTLRTSIIGHELSGSHALVEWFLSQQGPVRGFSRAIFSGLPTVELARVIRDYVLTNTALSGLYHVASEPINKFDLLCQIARVYSKPIEILQYDDFEIDRSLDGSRFSQATTYTPAPWPVLIERMHDFYKSNVYV